jgi:hypothetical protein
MRSFLTVDGSDAVIRDDPQALAAFRDAMKHQGKADAFSYNVREESSGLRAAQYAGHFDDASGDGGLANAAANRFVKVRVGVIAAKAGGEVGGVVLTLRYVAIGTITVTCLRPANFAQDSSDALPLACLEHRLDRLGAQRTLSASKAV